MKQAILIIAFQNLDHLQKIVDFLDDHFSFYIHIDKKSKIKDFELEKLRSSNKVKLIEKKFKINWGGLNLTRAIVYLAETAMKDESIEYLHVLSGADFPIKSSEQIRLQTHKHQVFLENFKLPNDCWDSGGINRLEYFYLTDLFNFKSYFGKKAINFTIYIQKFLGIRRKIRPDFPQLFGGPTWWSLSSSCMRFVLDYIQANPDYLRRFRNTWIPDELFFQTIVMNSKFKEKVVNDSMRLILWESIHQSHPKVLNDDDYALVASSTNIFARKFERGASDSLLELLMKTHSPRDIKIV